MYITMETSQSGVRHDMVSSSMKTAGAYSRLKSKPCDQG